MLVITRRAGESVVIGENAEVTVKVLEIRDNGNRVRLGIEAPKDMEIWRTEIYEKVLESRRNGNGKASQK